jgi:hypothetical protein
MKRLFMAAIVAAIMLVPAASASAFSGEFARFNTCPLSNPSVGFCLSAESTGGTFTVGKKTVPLVKPVNLRGGLITPEGLIGPATFVAPTDGVVISKAAQPVPGGLTGIVAPAWWPKVLRDLFNETINNGFTGVTATVELAGSASGVKVSLINYVIQSGAAFNLPVKIKLDNPFLGSSCYIGSNSNPVKLALTSGTTAPPAPNSPISGSIGEPGNFEEEKIIFFKHNKLVDNSFSAPGANGCGGFLFSWLVDPFVDSILGTPSASGTNTAILEGSTYLGNGVALRAM